MTDLKSAFQDSVKYVQSATGDFKPSNDLKLELYGLYKQSSEGDVSGKKPGITDFVGRAKYQAWEKCKGMSADQAMQSYIDKINDLRNQHG